MMAGEYIRECLGAHPEVWQAMDTGMQQAIGDHMHSHEGQIDLRKVESIYVPWPVEWEDLFE